MHSCYTGYSCQPATLEPLPPRHAFRMLMFLLGSLLPGMKSVIFGFNFLLGVLSATLVRALLKFLNKKKIIRREQINDFLMTRASNFFYDLMVVAGIAAIRLSTMKGYVGVLLIICITGAALTFAYNWLVSRVLFKDYQDEQIVAMYGMLTGTASTGIVLLRELDVEFKTPVSDNMVYQNFPAIVLGFPMMFLATLAPIQPVMTLGILIVFFVVMNIYIELLWIFLEIIRAFSSKTVFYFCLLR